MARRQIPGCAFALVFVVLQTALDAHVTLRTAGALAPSGYATVSLSVPTERPVATTRVVLDVPDDFLEAGGRISRLEFPANWMVTLEKAEMPADVYEKESADRRARAGDRAQGEHAADATDAQAERETAVLEEARRKWIKRIVFEGGRIPVDGFAEFRLSIVVPDKAGQYRFPATQVYEDGREVKWAELVEGAQRPAPTLIVAAPPGTLGTYWWPVVGTTALVLALASLLLRRQPVRA
jgi:uncharacterized protein YcnI